MGYAQWCVSYRLYICFLFCCCFLFVCLYVGAPVLFVLAEFLHVQVVRVGGQVRAEVRPKSQSPARDGEGEQEAEGRGEEEEERSHQGERREAEKPYQINYPPPLPPAVGTGFICSKTRQTSASSQGWSV